MAETSFSMEIFAGLRMSSRFAGERLRALRTAWAVAVACSGVVAVSCWPLMVMTR
jgi:hypothetical protein